MLQFKGQIWLYTVTKTGTYKVTVSNTTGCNKTSAGMKIYGPPNAAVTVGGPLEICPPDSLQLAVPYALTNTYQWKLNGVNISEQQATNIT
ncbi:MAG: hypothetical protein IPP46_18510 [Bacteroidetes bacterium]|nr:hypothetical protein [Bacteroidota bacterium]